MRILKKSNAKVFGLSMAPLVIAIAAIAWFRGDCAFAQSNVPVATPWAPGSQASIDDLALAVDREQSLRNVKSLLTLYSQYADAGLWDEMASLFADDAVIQSDDAVLAKGKSAIAAYMMKKGGGKKGMPVGSLYADYLVQPAVVLSYDGRSATGRLTQITMTGIGGKAQLSGGLQVDDFVQVNGVWKFSHMHIYPQFAGPYETGYVGLTPTFPLAPYPFSPGYSGHPVPDAPLHELRPAGSKLEDIERHVQALNDEDKVRALQNIYGYYIDRKMWSDVTDLFAADGVLEIAGQGVWNGPKGVAKELERDGPEGLQRGQANEHIQMPEIITIDTDGVEARARGLELGMLTPQLGQAYWTFSSFDNRYVKGADGKWRIREMRIFPRIKAEYSAGWSKSNIVDPAPGGANAPDKPSVSGTPQTSTVIPAFPGPNPATGLAVTIPAGFKLVGDDRLIPPPVIAPAAAPKGTVIARMTEARRKLDVSKGYDAVDNINNMFGYYLDDQTWDDMVANLAVNGTRSQGPGFFVGSDHVYRAMVQAHWDGPPSPTNPRDIIFVHTRLQPVIDVAPDAKSAKIRVRLFLHTISKTPGSFSIGMYPNDSAVLEGGVWKMLVSGEIDETYFGSAGWKAGWGNPTSRPLGPGPTVAPRTLDSRNPPGAGITNTIDFAPDIPWTLYDDFRRKDFVTTNWPEIKPMWFSYRNPVSGRVPPNYCPDILQCFGGR